LWGLVTKIFVSCHGEIFYFILLGPQLEVPVRDPPAEINLVDGHQLLVLEESPSGHPDVGDAGKKRKKKERRLKRRARRGDVGGGGGGRGHSLASLGGVDEGNSGVEHRLELEQVKVD